MRRFELVEQQPEIQSAGSYGPEVRPSGGANLRDATIADQPAPRGLVSGISRPYRDKLDAHALRFDEWSLTLAVQYKETKHGLTH